MRGSACCPQNLCQNAWQVRMHSPELHCVQCQRNQSPSICCAAPSPSGTACTLCHVRLKSGLLSIAANSCDLERTVCCAQPGLCKSLLLLLYFLACANLPLVIHEQLSKGRFAQASPYSWPDHAIVSTSELHVGALMTRALLSSLGILRFRYQILLLRSCELSLFPRGWGWGGPTGHPFVHGCE